jgi:hypothetical protein
MLLALALATMPHAPRMVLPSMPEPTDAERCETMRALAGQIRSNLPMMFDATSRTETIEVDCRRRRVVWSNSGVIPVGPPREGWRARKQSDWNAAICRDPVWKWMRIRGWRFLQAQASQGGERIIFDAERCPR